MSLFRNSTCPPERIEGPASTCHPDRSEGSASIRHPERSEGPAFASHPEATRCAAEAPGVRASQRRTTFVLKTAQALALAVAVCFTLGATDAGTRFNDLGHKMMCTCSCAQMLGECNHVGCPESGRMRDELSADIAAGKSDKQILDSFAAKYGATVLAAPTTEGFNLVAWIAPFAVFAAALLGTILLVRHWTVGKTEVVAQPADPELDALRDRIRHETGSEGGY